MCYDDLMNTIPHELIPPSKMTLHQVYKFVEKCKTHPKVMGFDVVWTHVPQPGNTIVWTFADWQAKYETIVVEKLDWDTFNGLRVEWEDKIDTNA